MINPLLIAAGIYITVGAIRFLAGELTEREKEKQQQIDLEIKAFREKYIDYTPDSIEVEKSLEYSAAKADLCRFLSESAKEQLSTYEGLYNEYRELIRRITGLLTSKDTVYTPLRKYSCELYLRQLSEAKERCFTYIGYLKDYIYNIEKFESAAPYYMKLPADYPFVGKIIWVNTALIEDMTFQYETTESLRFSITIEDYNSYELPEDTSVPVMITEYKNRGFRASLERGAFKSYELMNTHLGFSATVKRIEKNRVILAYQNMQGDFELNLGRDYLVNPNRFPPVHSLLTVYPIRWKYDLSSYNGRLPVDVSERKEDAGSSLEFDSFPICFSKDNFAVFDEYYRKNNLVDYNEEFLIGPLNQEFVSLQDNSEVKLQLGEIPLFIMRLHEEKDASERVLYRFEFDRMCDPNEKTFSADDIYVPFEVSLMPYIEGVSINTIQSYMGDERIEDSSALIWDVFEEFRIQHQIKRDRAGMGYFYKWENITDQLINVLEQGDSIRTSVEWIESDKKDAIFANIIDYDAFCSFINRFAQKTDAILRHEWKPQFFVKDEMENRYEVNVIDSGRRIRICGRNASKVFYNTQNTIELFAVNSPYAEYQQKNALKLFRTGQVVNPQIQVACLDGSSIVQSQEDNVEIDHFYNSLLAQNANQKQTVERALKEKNIFFVQGPPGTGKTTVIRELVEQELAHNEDMRILIVSQANVAVDNALSGLLDNHDKDIVRIGNSEKIASEFQPYRIQNKCFEYVEELKEREQEFDEDFVAEWKRTLIIKSGLGESYAPALYELIIRKHRIVGATCVGLARRKIGLERTEFDLVIIDEAGKALVAEMLIPLLRAQKAVIIGDQCQLPPIINPILYDEEKIDLEERAVSENMLFSHSFFERLFSCAPETNKIMLDTQYRMPAVIGSAISQLFYGGKLKNGKSTFSKTPVFFNSCLNFINFDDNKDYKEKKDAHKQITNEVEAQAVVSLISNIRKKESSCSIAVITPYKGQKWLICNSLLRCGIRYRLEKIAVDTVDSFQGSEADIVIFCCTRSITPTLFFRDMRRINVALSRTKRELVILGKMRYLYKFDGGNSYLAKLADYIRENGNVIASNDSAAIKNSRKKQHNSEIVIPTEQIGLPSAFYIQNVPDADVDMLIEEYYRNGDFSEQIQVKKTNTGYILVSGYAQFHAVQEMGLSECICSIV